MKLIKGQHYSTPHGELAYVGLFAGRFVCDECGRVRKQAHEFCANWELYRMGFVGEWYHYGSECVRKINR